MNTHAEVERLDHLGIISGVITDLKLVEFINMGTFSIVQSRGFGAVKTARLKWSEYITLLHKNLKNNFLCPWMCFIINFLFELS